MRISTDFRSVASATFLVLFGFAAEATAQGYNNEGMPFRDCSEDGASVGDEGVTGAPADTRRQAVDTGVSFEERQALVEERRRLTNRQVQQYDELLAQMPPNYPRRAEILFRKAEALWALAEVEYQAEYALFIECMNNWYACVSDEVCYEPAPDYGPATDLYKEILRGHSSYERIDEVMFRLGIGLIEDEQGQEGASFLSRLIENKPDSIYVPDACFELGEHYFDRDLLIPARQNYECVVNGYPESELFNDSMYKLCWVAINENEFEESVDCFQTVARNLEVSADPREAFRNQVFNDMLLAYAEIPDGWTLARDYFEQKGGDELMRRQLSRLSNLYDEQGKDEERVALLSYFLQRYATDEEVPSWAESVLDALTKIGDWDRYEERAREFIVMLDPRGTWALNNQDAERALNNAKLLAESTLLNIITRNFQEADRLQSMPEVQQQLFLEVAQDYEDFFRRFPESSEAYDQRFFYAELLYYKLANGGQWTDDYWLPREEFDQYLREAGNQYRQVVEMQPDPDAEHAHDSAVGALQVYDDFMKREVPTIDDPIPPPHRFEEEFDFDEAQQLGQASQDYVEIVQWFADLYPEDERIPAASWRAAALYLRTGQIEQAAERFETIIDHHPRHRFAHEAALAAFVCYSYVENWGKIEEVARQLLDVCGDMSGDAAEQICELDRLHQAIAYAMNNQANDLVEEARELEIDGDRSAAQAKRLEAADLRIALYREFPDSEWSPVALFNAAATYEQARQIDEAIGYYNEYLERYPEHELRSEATWVLALIHESQANFEQAANWFERVDEFEEYENRTNAAFNAARLREAMSDFDRAIELYEHFRALTDDEESKKQIYFTIASIEQDRGNLDAAYDRLQQFTETYPGDLVRWIRARATQANIRWEQGQQRAAYGLWEEILEAYGRGEMAFNDQDLPDGWITPPGMSIPDEEDRLAVLPQAAKARFMIADRKYEAAKASDLNYREGRWQELADKLAARGEALTEAQRAMYEVSNFGDAEWAVAAHARLGQLFYDFYKDIFALPAPDFDECLDRGFSYDDCDRVDQQYNDTLYNIGEPLRQKAMLQFEEALRIVRENGIYTDWTQLVNREMNDIDRTYRLGGAEGVEPDQTSDVFITTTYILDLSEKLAAFEEVQEMFAPESPDSLLVPGAPGAAPAGGAGAAPVEGGQSTPMPPAPSGDDGAAPSDGADDTAPEEGGDEDEGEEDADGGDTTAEEGASDESEGTEEAVDDDASDEDSETDGTDSGE